MLTLINRTKNMFIHDCMISKLVLRRSKKEAKEVYKKVIKKKKIKLLRLG